MKCRHNGSPRPKKNSECKNPLETFSPRFFAIKTASSSLIIFQRAKLSTRGITHLCRCNWRTFWRQSPAGSSPRGSCSCTTMPRLTGHLQPRRNWPRRTTTYSLDWKSIERSPFFVRRGGHCCRGDLVGRTNFCIFFLAWLAKVRTTG